MQLAEHLGDLSGELLSTPGKDARQQVSQKHHLTVSTFLSAQTAYLSLGNVEPSSSPDHRNATPISGQTSSKVLQIQVLDFSHI